MKQTTTTTNAAITAANAVWAKYRKEQAKAKAEAQAAAWAAKKAEMEAKKADKEGRHKDKAKAEEQAAAKRHFDDRRHAFEIAYPERFTNPEAYAAALMGFATPVSAAILKKYADPQRSTAWMRDKVSNNGFSAVIMAIRREVYADQELLENTVAANNDATFSYLNSDGEMEWNIPTSKAAVDAATNLIGETLGDGMDFVLEVATAIEEKAKRAEKRGVDTSAADWMVTRYIDRHIKRKVLIKDETAAWIDESTCALVEVYRHARRYVLQTRAAAADPRSKYTYIEDYATDEMGGLEVINRRLMRYGDIDVMMDGTVFTVRSMDCHGRITSIAIEKSPLEYYAALEAMKLSKREAEIILMKEAELGEESIASKLGIGKGNVYNVASRARAKAEKIGFTVEAHRAIEAAARAAAEASEK